MLFSKKIIPVIFILIICVIVSIVLLVIELKKECSFIKHCSATHRCVDTKCMNNYLVVTPTCSCSQGYICIDSICVFESTSIQSYKQSSQFYSAFNSTLWPNSIVPFVIDSTLTSSQFISITLAIHYFTNSTKIQLIPKTNQPDYIIFSDDNSNSCYSLIGKYNGWQKINISPSCEYNHIVHELMHSLGWSHEHSRYDRDNYVVINYSNIISTDVFNFNITPFYVSRLLNNITTFDYNSIMLYSVSAFSINDQPTISTITDTPVSPCPLLSPTDILKLNKYYDLSKKIEIFKDFY